MPKALIAVTSFHEKFYPDGLKTGLFAPEAIEPFEVFRAQGFEVDFASETGTFGYDDNSLKEDFLNGDVANIFNNAHSEYNVAIKKIQKASNVNPKEYDIFYAAGGHGTLVDFPTASGLQEIAQVIWSQGGVVAALCHAPAILANIIDTKTGKPVAQGRSITGFTAEGEHAFNVAETMKEKGLLTVEEWAQKLGAKYVPPPAPFADFNLNDGKLVTGVNPASARSTALKAVHVLH